MNTDFELTIVTPIETKILKNVQSLLIDTDNGVLEFLPNHSDLIVTITLGKTKVKVSDKESTYVAGQGFIIFQNKENKAKMVVSKFIEQEKLERLDYKEIVDKIENLLKNNKSLDSFTIKYLENQKAGISYKDK